MKRWVDYLIIVLVGLITHGLLLLNDGVYWDGWLLYSRLVNGESLLSWFVEAGRPIEFCFHWIMGCFPVLIFGYKCVAFLSVIFTAILIYIICDKSKLVSRGESLLISVIVLTYPVFHVGVEMTIVPYLFFYMLFCLAVFLAFKSEETTGAIHCVWRMLALIVFFISFSLYSLLVFFFGFLLVLMLHARRCHGLSLRQITARFLPGHIDYLILPFLFWFLNGWLFPLSEFYAHASDKLFKLNFSSMKGCFAGFVQYAFCGQWVEAFGRLFTLPLFMLLILLFAYRAYDIFKLAKLRWFSPENRPWHFIILGIILFIAGAFPYTVVGACPKMYSWDTRHALLMGLPMALILVGLFRLVFSRNGEHFSRLGFMALIMVIAALSLSNINAYFFWQSVWIKNRSIMYHLSQKTCVRAISTFWIDQRLQLPKDEAGHFYVWASMFNKSWGDEAHIGFPGRFPNKVSSGFLKSVKQSFCQRGYNIATYDPDGPQAILVVRRGPALYNDWNLATRYLFLKHFRPEKVDEFFSGVTQMHVELCPRNRPVISTGDVGLSSP